MIHTLKNKNLEIHINNPLEGYRFSRFDWTGKIISVKFQNIPLTTNERIDEKNQDYFGKALYNEFGIDSALGFEETAIGDWFHKIGVGLLRKEDASYQFSKRYQVRPAKFETRSNSNRMMITCASEKVNGYSYVLRKEVELLEDRFVIRYHLENTGEKDIVTDEYVHNFMAIGNDRVGKNYKLRFPFQLNPTQFAASVNPQEMVRFMKNKIGFNGHSKEPFFFSDLSGGKNVRAQWELTNLKWNVGIVETCNFQTNKINLWGWQHVISPELFFNINLTPGKVVSWTRTYCVFSVEDPLV